MPQKNKGASPPECLVVVVIDGTYRLENHSEIIFKAYLESILKHLKSPYVEDKERKEKIWPNLRCGLVTFGHYEPYSSVPVKSHYFESLSQFEELISGIEFANGRMYENAVAEGLVSALEMFDLHASQMEPDAPQPKRHCVLISNSHPCPDPVHRNISSKYDDYTIEQVAGEMQKQNIYLSLITPEKGFDELEDLVKTVNRDVEVHDASDVVNPSHVVKLANFKVPFLQPTEVVDTEKKKRKREDSIPINDAHANEQPTSTGSTSSSPESKKVKLENTDEQSREQVPSVSAQQSSRQSEVASETKKQVTSPVQPAQQQPSNPPQVSSPQVSRSSPVVSNAPSQVISVPHNQIQQTIKAPQPVPQQPVAPQLPTPLSSSTTIGGVRPMTNMLQLKYLASDHHRNRLMSAIQNNAQLLQQNKILQNELVASQQNLADALRRQQLGQSATPGGIRQNFATTTPPIGNDAQALNNYSSSPSLGSVVNVNTQNIGAFNVPGSSTQAVGAFATTTSPVIGFTPAALNARIPTTTIGGSPVTAAVGMSSISAASNNIRAPNPTVNINGQMGINNVTSAAASVIGANTNQMRPNMHPTKTVNALWSGHIAWAANNQQNGAKRELTCHVTAFPVLQKRNGPSSLNDYMTHVWPDKMEISSINLAKDVMKDAGNNPKPHVVSFLPTPPPTASSENQNTFMVLMRILDSKKLAAFARFPNAPTSNGGIVLFTNGPKLVGLLFLDSPLPTSLNVASQQQQSQSQQSQLALQHQILQQQMLLRQQAQQAQQQQPIQTQQQLLSTLQLQQQQQAFQAIQQQLQQQQSLQQILQQQRRVNPQMQVPRLPTQPSPQSVTQQMMLQRQMQLSSLFQTASNSNPRMDGQDIVNYVRQQRQQTQQQQPTQ